MTGMIRIPTGALIDLITDLSHTTAPREAGAISCILLHTDRGYGIPTEPGKNDLLVGTSTNRFAVGHCYVTCYGQLTGPMLWPITEALGIVASLKPRVRDNKDHSVEIRQEGDHVLIKEDGDLFDDGSEWRFLAGDLLAYPHGLFEVLTAIPVTTKRHRQRMDFNPTVFAAFMAVAKRRNCMIETYRYTEKGTVMIQIGDRYRGLVTPPPWNYDDTRAGQAPDGDVYSVVLPALEADEQELPLPEPEPADA